MNLDLVRVKLVKESTVTYGAAATSPDAAVSAMREYLSDLAQEAVIGIYTSAAGEVVNASILALGGLTTAIIEPRMALLPALLGNAEGMILMHNHPSLNPQPSKEDVAVTRRLQEACNIMGIKFNDHIIVGGNKYYSFFEDKKL